MMRIGFSYRFQEQTSFFDVTNEGEKTGRNVFSTLANNSPESLSTLVCFSTAPSDAQYL